LGLLRHKFRTSSTVITPIIYQTPCQKVISIDVVLFDQHAAGCPKILQQLFGRVKPFGVGCIQRVGIYRSFLNFSPLLLCVSADEDGHIFV